MKKYDKAIEFSEQALKIKSNTENAIEHNFQSLNLWGIILTNQMNYEAMKKFETALDLCTDDMIDKKKIALNSSANCCYKLEQSEKLLK